ncbi:uncharacterized protein G2W53_035325 [Senna tora]|uniref:Uncharacterized protein n=1 Tax=Senna tora TaxID=362788 RepID=A0A834W3W0_9FABA|nr:uncharacterized protein G2W53_035325 [Senna tora]
MACLVLNTLSLTLRHLLTGTKLSQQRLIPPQR